MRMFPEKYRLPVCIGALLITGFVTTGIASHGAARDAVQRDISEHVLPLTGDSVYAGIQTDILRPTVIASMMAGDSFVRDWLLTGETDSAQIVRYLDEVRRQYGAVTSFLISDRSRTSYYADGTLRKIDENDPRDGWFFRAKRANALFVTDMAADPANRAAPTVFVNYRMLDRDGSFLGIAGIGLRLDALTARIDAGEARSGSRIYFVDPKGALMLAGTAQPHPAGAPALPAGLRDSGKPARLDYHQNGVLMLANVRYVPELGWYLVVEQNATDGAHPVKNVFAINFAIGAAITLLVFVIALITVNRYRKQLELVAGTDPLTGLLNRQAFEIVFRQSVREAERSGQPLSGILFDVDLFRQINDSHSYLVGDKVLHAIAQLTRETVRECDIVARWGGEEFILLLKDCALEQAVTVAEKLCAAIDRHDFSAIVPEHHITISLGVAQYGMQEPAGVFIARADEALFKAKANGRNRLQVARGAADNALLI